VGTATVGTSAYVANALLNNKYANDATVFAIGNTTKYTGAAPYDLKSTNIGWDFTAGATNTTGITSAAPDQTPVVFSDIGASTTIVAQSGGGYQVQALPATTPFQQNGVAVAYKSNSALFIKATSVTGGSNVSNFISSSFSDSWANYTVIKP